MGSKDFRAGLIKEMKLKGAELDRTGLLGELGDRQRLREEQWEERLQAFAIEMRIDLTALPRRKSAPEKVQLASRMKSATAAQNAWLAQRLEMGTPASVSQFVRFNGIKYVKS